MENINDYSFYVNLSYLIVIILMLSIAIANLINYSKNFKKLESYQKKPD